MLDRLHLSLDYGYTIILSRVARDLASRGYLTQIGIHHRGELNQWNLACDLMEPFRPYIDMVIIRTNVGEFNAETRRQLIDITSDRVPYDDGRYHLGGVISLYVKECTDALNKRISPSDIKCYEIV